MVDEREFLDFVSRLLRVPAERLSLDTAYGELPEWDSVMHLRLAMETENAFGVSFSLEEIPSLKTLGAFFSKLGGERKGA